jgi:hypothetical protein
MSLLVKFIKERVGMSSPTSKPYKHAEYCLISLPLGEVTVVCVGLITYSFFVRSKISCSSFFILSIVIFSIVVFFKGALAFENNVARKPVINGESELALVKNVLLWLNTRPLGTFGELTLKATLMGIGRYLRSSSFFGTGGTHRPSGMFLSGRDLPLIRPYRIG